MADNKFRELAQQVLDKVGGKENVTYAAHCMTRLRLNLRDKSLVDEEAVKAIDGVIGLKWAGEQCQVIIGTTAKDVYAEFVDLAEVSAQAAVDENLDEEVKEPLTIKNIFPRMIETMAGIMLPNIPMMVTMGMFAAIIAVIGPTGLGLVQESDGIYRLLYWAQQGISFFMPIAVAYRAAIKFKGSELNAMALLFIMLYPDLLNAINQIEGVEPLSIFGFIPQVAPINGQMIPVILDVLLLAYVEKFWDKVLPESLRFSFTGVLSLLVVLPVALYLINPLGVAAGNALATPVNFVYGICPPVVTALLGAIYLPLIMTGMHQVFAIMFFTQFFMTGSEFALMPIMMALPLITTSTNAAVAVRSKDERGLAINGIISCLLGGVVEPSLYGIYLQYKRTMLAFCAGLGATGLVIGLLHVGVFSFPAFNIIGLTSVLAGGTGNFVNFLIACAVGMAVSFAIIFVGGMGEKEA